MTSTPNATLVAEKGLPDAGPIPIGPGVSVFGKSSTVDVNIDNTYVSRRQFQIRCQDDVFFITDLGSTNGTFLNGERLDPQREQRLRDRDLIGLAEDQVVFRFNDLVKTVSAGLSKRPTSRPPLLMWWVGLAGMMALVLVFGTLTLLNPSLTKWSVEATSLAPVATPPADISLATKPTAPTMTTVAAVPGMLASLVQLEVMIDPRRAAEILLSPPPLGRGGYVLGRTVTIFVTPKPGWEIQEWVGPVYRVQGETAMVDMDGSQAVMVVLMPDTALPVGIPVPPATPVALAPTPTSAPAPSSSVRIVFKSTRNGYGEIYVMNADGSNQTRLTNNAATDGFPSWSPGGTKIAFNSDRDGNGEIYVMNADGSGQVRLTDNSVVDNYPAWSPDGSKVAFTSRRDGNEAIYVMNTDGSGQTRLTDASGYSINPSWSPDSTKIAFTSTREGPELIYVMAADGSGQTRLSDAWGWEPAWSPHGDKIAFASKYNRHQVPGMLVDEIDVINADGTNRTRLTNGPGDAGEPAWSPDGTKIAFRTNRDGNSEIYVMNADGTEQTRLTNDPGTDEQPAWTP